ncbi:S1C family serine protease [Brumimicrobium oceani]|uniref:Serine protease n=1 Tax=Brumimicrobium oceani TaxID=2100725 RepID=A0A2U2XD46_9FLAO|nr:serine protease [Brumimicrobium oceani]PWH85631.1 hypothetical protein DIT68_08310 [Brumimicrobium oceani]
MKKIILLTIINLIGFGTFAQDTESLNYSTINLIRSGNFLGSSCASDIIFPNQRKFNLSLKSHVEYKIYSTGQIAITVEESCPATPNTTASFSSQQLIIEVEANKEYYVLYNAFRFEQFEKEDIEKHLKKAKDNKMTYSENLDAPINRASIVANKIGPSQGTGFLINKDGYIITNNHVIEGAKKIIVRGIKGDFNTSFEAELVSADGQNDLALLKVNSNLIEFSNPPYQFGNVDSIRKAQEVLALGYPLKNIMGEEIKASSGTINSLSGYKGSISQLQFSAVVQPGSSGGPLFNSQGEIIGVISSKIRSDLADNVNYAIKVNYLAFFLSQIKEVELNLEKGTVKNWSPSRIVEESSNFIYIIETE